MTHTTIATAHGGAPRRLSRSWAFLQQAVHDPGHVSLRRGLRAAVVLPLLLASGTRLAGPGQSVSAFLVFGAMSLLVLADFGGQTRSRAMAYITTTLLGVPLVVVGTLASGTV